MPSMPIYAKIWFTIPILLALGVVLSALWVNAGYYDVEKITLILLYLITGWLGITTLGLVMGIIWFA